MTAQGKRHAANRLGLVARGVGSYAVKERVIDPYLAKEKVSATVGD
jgi:hypothetical protein